MCPYVFVCACIHAQAACARDPPLNLDTSAAPPSADSFYPISLPNPPSNEFRHLTHQQQFAGLNDAARLSNGPFVIKSSIRTQIRAYYITFHERDLAFAQDMGRLHIIAPQNLNKVQVDPEHTVPHSLITEMYALMHEMIICRLLNTEYADQAAVVCQLDDFYSRLAAANACADLILLRAMDACAILGGVELPRWPPTKAWRGAVINLKNLPTPGIQLSEDGERFLATLRQLEQWGVPIWGYSISSANSRYDVRPEGLPREHEFEEEMFQYMLHSVDQHSVQCTKVVQTVERVHTNDVLVPAYTGIPMGSEHLQHAIVSLIDHDSPSHTNFASFSAIARDILGSTIWTGNRHEAALHPISLDTSEPMPWTRVRDAIRECAHCGVNIALFQIPLPWIDSHSAVATCSGQYALTEQIAGASLVAAPCGTWFTLNVDDFKMDDKSVVQQLAERFVLDGLCRWLFVQSGLQKKDVNGKTIPCSWFTAQFLFKHHHVQEAVVKCIHTDYHNHEQ